MRVEDLITTLPKDHYSHIEDKIHKVICAVDQIFIYEGHIPIVAFLLISGRARLTKRRLSTDIDDGLTLIGAQEFLSQIPFSYALTIEKGSQLGFIDRSTLLSICSDTKDSVFDLVEEKV